MCNAANQFVHLDIPILIEVHLCPLVINAKL